MVGQHVGKSGVVLVTGATGYVGGLLVPKLLEEGHSVRVLVRDPSRIQGRPWVSRARVSTGDVLNPDSLVAAMGGVDSAYYLVHSLKDSLEFHQRDLIAASNFARAAKAAGTRRIIYLGGLGEAGSGLSEHLRSRHETGEVLRRHEVPVTEFRAAIVVGAGSASFEMIRYLVERLPVMVCPRWVYTRVQPMSIRDVLDYLVAALETSDSAGRVVEIGGADVTTYGGMMLGYAQARGLKRVLIRVPVLTPRLSSYWVHWMTPIPASIARPLIEGLRSEVVVRDLSARTLFPEIKPMDYTRAVKLTLEKLEAGKIETSWADSSSSVGGRTRLPLCRSTGA